MALGINVEKYSWAQFNISYYYPAPIEVVFSKWATCSGLESFFIQKISLSALNGERRLPNQIFQASDNYEWTWRHGFSLKGKIIEVEKNKFLAFSFGNMKISIYFKSRGAKTLVHLVQNQINEDEAGKVMGHLNCRSCWVFFMTNLKSILLNGTDLRDDEPAIASAFEVGFMPEELN